MDLLVEGSTGCISPAMLADAMAKHYAAHVIAYGCTIFVPKHHFMLHIPKQLERFKFLVACWVTEAASAPCQQENGFPSCIATLVDCSYTASRHRGCISPVSARKRGFPSCIAKLVDCS